MREEMEEMEKSPNTEEERERESGWEDAGKERALLRGGEGKEQEEEGASMML